LVNPTTIRRTGSVTAVEEDSNAGRRGWFGRLDERERAPVPVIVYGEIIYRGKKIGLSEVSWLKRLLQRAHTKMDHDPAVWALVERTILDVIGVLYDCTQPRP
jgi:flagella basal body P-ring formation protein FlgA